MKKTLIIKHLLFLLVLTFILSCSKKSDEVTPSSVAGKWKQNGVTGKITVVQNGKTVSQDINEAADNSIIEFKADGTGTLDGDAITYKTSGTVLTITAGGQSLDFTAKVSGNNLTLGFTKDQFFKYVDLVGDPSDPDVATLISLKPFITDFTYNINYVKQ
jgi:hypothetical protein